MSPSETAAGGRQSLHPRQSHTVTIVPYFLQ